MAMKGVSTKTAPQWAFRSRLRRGGFGWRGSKPAIARIDEALAEIRAVARHDAALAAEGAVLVLEKVAPAVRDVDSSPCDPKDAPGDGDSRPVTRRTRICGDRIPSDRAVGYWELSRLGSGKRHQKTVPQFRAVSGQSRRCGGETSDICGTESDVSI
jgi:hypothetical protein